MLQFYVVHLHFIVKLETDILKLDSDILQLEKLQMHTLFV